MTDSARWDSGVDALEFMAQQHAQIKDLMGLVRSSAGETREQRFYDLRLLLAVHEAGEERVVHPQVRRELPSHDDHKVAERLSEELKIKDAVLLLEKLDMDSTRFETAFDAFTDKVLTHFANEETVEWPLLRHSEDVATLRKLTAALRESERAASPRPHPGVEGSKANARMVSFVKMLDEARDKLSGKHPRRPSDLT